MANKNSVYVQSLVSFILDTKPYHSKLTEIVEEYQFYDEMNVHIAERMFSSNFTKAAWLYSHFSNGGSTAVTPAHQLTNPLFRAFTNNNTPSLNRGAFKTGRDEDEDLTGVPYTYDPKSLTGAGISDAFVQRNGIIREPLQEGHDFYQSHGAYVLRIESTISPIAIVTGTYEHAFTVDDGPYPVIVNLSFDSDVLVLSGPVTQISLTQVSVASVGVVSVTGLSSDPNVDPIFVEKPDEASYGPATRQGGRLNYEDIITDKIQITNVVGNPLREVYEAFTLTATSTSTVEVVGTNSGIIGTVSIPGTLNIAQIKFDIALGTTPLVVGDTFRLIPSAKVTIHGDAPHEVWSIIKTNPLAYSRPLLASNRYGYLVDQTNQRNLISVLDTTLPTGTIIIRATSSTSFHISSTADPLYSATATVNVPYNDGKIAFTIKAGSAQPFVVGDVFFAEIMNEPAYAEELDLYYGFDMDPFDGHDLVYNNVSNLLDDYLTTLDFGYDSRFVNYDTSAFNLVVAESAVDGRQWRLRAVSNGVDLNLGTHVPPGQVNLLATDDPTNPAATSQYDSTNDVVGGQETATDPDTVDDLRLFYADTFELEYLNSSDVWVSVDNIAIGVPYTNVTHGLSFTIVPATKPFIAAELHTSWNTVSAGPFTATILGGDVISWVVRNGLAQTEPAQLVSDNVARLIVHGGSYHTSTEGKWTLTWTSGTQYQLVGTYTSGVSVGLPFYTTTVDLANGKSYRNDTYGLHFTVHTGSVGLTAPDSLSFTVYADKPSDLVHGSMSGWQPEATVGEWYWNGKIGFYIKSPALECFYADERVAAPWNIPGVGTFSLASVRPDTPTSVYRLRGKVSADTTLKQWMMYRNGKAVASGTTVVFDEFLKLNAPTPVDGEEIFFYVHGDEHALCMGHDLGIIRTTPGRLPTNDDFVLFERSVSDDVTISIKPHNSAHALVLADLAPVTIDLRFVDHETNNGGVPLSVTSPETAVLQGWIPATKIFRDSATSVAEFKDPATNVVVKAIATGETIGTLASTGTNPAEPVVFTWDPGFALKYLPLNAEASIVTLGNGMNEHVNVNMIESIRFSTEGALDPANALFAEIISVNVTDDYPGGQTVGQPAGWRFLSEHTYDEDSIAVTIVDGPFGGFAPGYDNMPFDFETQYVFKAQYWEDETFPFNVTVPFTAASMFISGPATQVNSTTISITGPGFVLAAPIAIDNETTGAYFDAGQGMRWVYDQAKILAELVSPSPQEQALLNDYTALVNPYLVNGDLDSTTVDEFLAALAADPAINFNPVQVPEFGIPVLGHGIATSNQPIAPVSASTNEVMLIGITFSGYPYFDGDDEFDAGPMEDQDGSVMRMYSQELWPIPDPIPTLTTYAALDTPLYMEAPGYRTVEFTFPTEIGGTIPNIRIWRPGEASPTYIPVVEKVGPRVLRISQPFATEAKFIIG